jgi:hypothetical protein
MDLAATALAPAQMALVEHSARLLLLLVHLSTVVGMAPAAEAAAYAQMDTLEAAVRQVRTFSDAYCT